MASFDTQEATDLHAAWLHPLDADKYLALITTVGSLCSCTVILAPIGFMIKVLNGGVSAHDAMSMFPTMVMMFIQAALWACFGFVTLHLSICHINAFGALMAAVYLRILADATHGLLRQRMDLIFIGVLSSVCLFCAALMLCVQDTKLQKSVFSNLAILFNIGLYVSPIGQLCEIFQTKKIDNFPIGLTICGFVSALLWSEYSLIIKSQAYLIPNLVGLACNSTSMLCYSYLCISVSRSGDMEHLPLVKNRDFQSAYTDVKRDSCSKTQVRKSTESEDTDYLSEGVISTDDVNSNHRSSDDDVESCCATGGTGSSIDDV